MDTNSIYSEIKTAFETDTNVIVHDESDLSIRMKIVANEMAKLYERLEFCEKQLFAQTATGEYLELHGTSRGLEKKYERGAIGAVTFYADEIVTQHISIPKGTLITSSNGNGVIYQTTKDTSIFTGYDRVNTIVEATETGSHTNAKAGTVDTIINHIAGVTRVTNVGDFMYGSEDESEEAFRTRILESYRHPSNGANLKYFEEMALELDEVYFAKAESTSVNNTIDLYISDYFRFTSAELVQTVQTLVDANRAFNTNIAVKAATPVTVNVNVILYVRSIGDEVSKNIAATNFITQKILDHTVGQEFNPYMICNGLNEIIDDLVDIKFTAPTTTVNIAANSIANLGLVSVFVERID